MFDFAVKFVLSLVVSHWVYSETCLLVPNFKEFAANFYHTVRIPTHDEWPEIASSDSAKSLNGSLDEAWIQVAEVLKVDPRNFVGVFSPKVRELWHSTSLANPVNLDSIPQRAARILPDTSQRPFLNGRIIRARFASDRRLIRKS